MDESREGSDCASDAMTVRSCINVAVHLLVLLLLLLLLRLLLCLRGQRV